MHSLASDIDKDTYEVKCHIRAQCAPPPLQSHMCWGGGKVVPGPTFPNLAWAQRMRNENVPVIIFRGGGGDQVRLSLFIILK